MSNVPFLPTTKKDIFDCQQKKQYQDPTIEVKRKMLKETVDNNTEQNFFSPS